MNVFRVQRLALWDGIDAVFWKKGDGDLEGSSGDPDPAEVVSLRHQLRHHVYRDHARVIARMAPHLPNGEAIIHVGKHNVRLFYRDDSLLLVFLRTGHSSAKSIRRAIRRVFAAKERVVVP